MQGVKALCADPRCQLQMCWTGLKTPMEREFQSAMMASEIVLVSVLKNKAPQPVCHERALGCSWETAL